MTTAEIVFASLVISAGIVFLVHINLEFYGRRRKMTKEERQAQDDELGGGW